jgi:hypothetical protein
MAMRGREGAMPQPIAAPTRPPPTMAMSYSKVFKGPAMYPNAT